MRLNGMAKIYIKQGKRIKIAVLMLEYLRKMYERKQNITTKFGIDFTTSIINILENNL